MKAASGAKIRVHRLRVISPTSGLPAIRELGARLAGLVLLPQASQFAVEKPTTQDLVDQMTSTVLLTVNMKSSIPVDRQQRRKMSQASEVPYGTLDLLVLKTLDTMGPLHGFGVARRIEQLTDGGMALNQGTIYPALLRLEQKGWIESEWGTSEKGRRARYYSITRAGRKQLQKEIEDWARISAMVGKVLDGAQ